MLPIFAQDDQVANQHLHLITGLSRVLPSSGALERFVKQRLDALSVALNLSIEAEHEFGLLIVHQNV